MRWADGSTTTLHIVVTPADHACIGQRPLYMGVGTQSTELALPLDLQLTTDDGKLDAMIRGAMHAALVDDAAWDGTAELDSALSSLPAVVGTDPDAFFEAPSGSLSFLQLMLVVPIERDDGYAQIYFDAYQPYDGVPEFPDVAEESSNRLNCFARAASGKSLENIRRKEIRKTGVQNLRSRVNPLTSMCGTAQSRRFMIAAHTTAQPAPHAGGALAARSTHADAGSTWA